ncbi:MAG: SDR family NAD(P)-dependent oxidoreductase [Gammaproteobacteria bacterium]|tara:strand:+ start:354 stop:1187 length:834 start_codon:yes stop_codon:yes gene_type:complete
MYSYKGKLALVTGASTGIGYAIAKELARRGANLILSATVRSEDKLHELSSEIKDLGSECHIFLEDLSRLNSGRSLYDQIKLQNLHVDLLINNAGYGRWGTFHEVEMEDYADMIQLNITSLSELSHLFIPDMISKGEGGVINVGSVASLTPVPYSSVYAATKAYVLSLSEGLRYEYRNSNIRIMALLPGATVSNFGQVATAKSDKLRERLNKRTKRSAAGTVFQTSHEVALECLDGFTKDKQFIIPGRGNRRTALITKFMPRTKVLNTVGSLFKKIAG